MHIRLHDARTVALEFPYSAATVARVKALAAVWDKESKTWSAPLASLRRIIDAFPGATLDPACVDARMAMWRRWVRQYNACGIRFILDRTSQTVVAIGPGVSPVFQEWVAKNSGVLAQFLNDQVARVERTPLPAPSVEPSHGDRLIWV